MWSSPASVSCGPESEALEVGVDADHVDLVQRRRRGASSSRTRPGDRRARGGAGRRRSNHGWRIRWRSVSTVQPCCSWWPANARLLTASHASSSRPGRNDRVATSDATVRRQLPAHLPQLAIGTEADVVGDRVVDRVGRIHPPVDPAATVRGDRRERGWTQAFVSPSRHGAADRSPPASSSRRRGATRWRCRRRRPTRRRAERRRSAACLRRGGRRDRRRVDRTGRRTRRHVRRRRAGAVR